MLFKNKPCEKCGNYYDPTFEECPLCKTKDAKFEERNIPKKVAWLSAWQQILIFLVGFAFGGMLFFQLLFSKIFATTIQNNEVLGTFLVISLSYVAIFVTEILIMLPRAKHFLSHFKNYDSYLYGIAYAATIYAVSIVVALIMTYGFGATTNGNQGRVETYFDAYPFVSFIIMGIIGPICEEMAFRVGLYSFVRRLNKYVAILVSTLAFIVIHMSFDPETIVNELLNIPSYAVAGILFAIAYEHKGPACSMTAHIVYNSASLILMLIAK